MKYDFDPLGYAETHERRRDEEIRRAELRHQVTVRFKVDGPKRAASSRSARVPVRAIDYLSLGRSSPCLAEEHVCRPAA
jgi:hypothetical protein